jgi:LmbE family N-acetylglucosaminyl deacetylase
VTGYERVNRYVDVTDVWERKMAALHAHASQHPDPAALDGMMRGWNGANAAAAGLPAGRLAEGFWVMDTP